MRWLALSLALFAFPQVAGAMDYGIWGGAHLGLGKIGYDSNAIYQKRSVGTLDLQALPGAHFYGKSILAGLLFDFRYLSQLSNVDEASVGNLGGSGLTIGPAVLFDLTFGRLLLSWDWRDRQSINLPDSTTFKGSGFHFLFGYRWTPRVTLDFEYVIASYNTLSSAGQESELTPKVRHSNVGLGVSVAL